MSGITQKQDDILNELSMAFRVRVEKGETLKPEILALFMASARICRTILTVGTAIFTEVQSLRMLTMGQLPEVQKRYHGGEQSRIIRID